MGMSNGFCWSLIVVSKFFLIDQLISSESRYILAILDFHIVFKVVFPDVAISNGDVFLMWGIKLSPKFSLSGSLSTLPLHLSLPPSVARPRAVKRASETRALWLWTGAQGVSVCVWVYCHSWTVCEWEKEGGRRVLYRVCYSQRERIERKRDSITISLQRGLSVTEVEEKERRGTEAPCWKVKPF